MAENISLPSIHEMFPEHLLCISPEVRIKYNTSPTLVPSHPYVPTPPLRRREQYSSDFRRLGTAYSSPFSHKSPAAKGIQDLSRRSPPSASDDGEDDTKRFICSICNKRFGRPSGLKIHINTHTGATPFRCPVVGCRREFNVNSNMLRHYRNHMNSTVASSRSISSPYSERPMTASRDYTQLSGSMKKSKLIWRPTLSIPSFDEREQQGGQLRDVAFFREKYDKRYMERGPGMCRYEQQDLISNIPSARESYGREHEIGGSYPYERRHSYYYAN
ncbi:uncharacterized protein EV420DRAFT_694574 [Desarmillaria tabescens]|uniref:C2H2-type domain-containing protein n=1 Tax=Armillaria tabescens TaxID=1929756 RepID=A0AA39MZ20_ARMTA|nr:uncharacterized protein EV420DRAFT_694574 [Desarmillaria tabescens]KAK0452161.1 hypothetical protein EV420DRAFT_694574 [Desarmillaria tabescens]